MASISGTNAFVGYDGNGNITALIDAGNKSTAAAYEYSPFGELIRATGPLGHANPFRWSTKFWDEESGLVYYGFRYYSPQQGRWIQRDPAGEVDVENLYTALRNTPLSVFDADGRFGEALAPLIELAMKNNPDVARQLALLRQNRQMVEMQSLFMKIDTIGNKATFGIAADTIVRGARIATGALFAMTKTLAEITIDPGSIETLSLESELMGAYFQNDRFMRSTERIVENRLKNSGFVSQVMGLQVGVLAAIMNQTGGNGEDFILDSSLAAAGTLGVGSSENIWGVGTTFAEY